jgi:hypothetical protein
VIVRTSGREISQYIWLKRYSLVVGLVVVVVVVAVEIVVNCLLSALLYPFYCTKQQHSTQAVQSGGFWQSRE